MPTKVNKVSDDLWIIDFNYDLAYSPDEGGYYFTHWAEDRKTRTSQMFPSKEVALKELKLGKIEWSDWK